MLCFRKVAERGSLAKLFPYCATHIVMNAQSSLCPKMLAMY